VFVQFLLLLISNIILLWFDIQESISVFLYLLRFALWPKMWYVWGKFHRLLRRVCILQLLDGIICRCLLNPFDQSSHLSLRYLCCFFCLDDLAIHDSGIWNHLLLLYLDLSFLLYLMFIL
jgi:hypothetical protein